MTRPSLKTTLVVVCVISAVLATAGCGHRGSTAAAPPPPPAPASPQLQQFQMQHAKGAAEDGQRRAAAMGKLDHH